MKPTDFSTHLTQYLTHYLAAQRNLSPNTIRAYRDVFTLLLRFCRDRRGVAIERLNLAHIDSSLVKAFLEHLAKERNVSIATQNQRLAVLHSFFRYVQSEVPERMLQCQRILAIPLQRQPRANDHYRMHSLTLPPPDAIQTDVEGKPLPQPCGKKIKICIWVDGKMEIDRYFFSFIHFIIKYK